MPISYKDQQNNFNPLPPCGGRPVTYSNDLIDVRFQSTPSVWRETAADGSSYSALPCISIHSLRVEGDILGVLETRWHIIFQSTPSVWRETGENHAVCIVYSISIHSLRVEGDRSFHNFGFRSKKFQSTPSVWRETSGATRLRTGGKNFNPLPPCGGRHSHTHTLIVCSNISIHSLRVEGDL